MPNQPAPPHARFPWAAAAGLSLMGCAAIGAVIVYLDQPLAVMFAAGAAVGAAGVAILMRLRRPRRSRAFVSAPAPKRLGRNKRPATAKPLEIDIGQFVKPGELKQIEQQKKIAAIRDHPATSEEERAAAARAMNRKRRGARKEA
jgi:hypothetical protein